MKHKEFVYKSWSVKYTPEDGARLESLQFDGVDLLTTKPDSFSAPKADYGEYETRPVYGYDDCFPSVSACPYPGHDLVIPDHGEVCWLPWEIIEKPDGLEFSVRSQALPFLLKREMRFSDNSLTWLFEVHNQGKEALPFQHVIHPVMPLDDVVGMQMPSFTSAFDDINQKTLKVKSPEDLRNYLLKQPKGTANMLFLQNVKEGKLSLEFRALTRQAGSLKLEMHFPLELFPTVGIWWNNDGYPDEDGIRRNECAFEPISGSNSSLEDAHKEGSCLSVLPGEKMNWQIEWRMKG